MCGIFAVFNFKGARGREKALALSKRVRHRGPDWNGVKVSKQNNYIAHERLAIVGVESGAQPLSTDNEALILSVNGEIYNHLQLRAGLTKQHEFKTESDCEVILYLYQERDTNFVDELDGIFSFVLYDSVKDRVFIARDPIGVTTLYIGFNTKERSLWVASEMKSIHDECDVIQSFPPGHYFALDLANGKTLEEPGFQLQNSFHRYYQPNWFDETGFFPSVSPTAEPNYAKLRHALEAAVHKRLMSEVPFGVLLSGGLDSSLIASIAARAVEQYNKHKTHESESSKQDVNGKTDLEDEEYDEKLSAYKALEWFPKLHSFSIGVSHDAPDIKAAREAAKFLKTEHHEYTFTIDEGIDAISDIIWHLETYDVTTIRASTPMYLLSRRIKSIGVKMVLSGEGSDEILGGYLYFFHAPNAKEFHVETVRRVKNLHLSDCLRANKSTMAWGLEARVPFLDKDFLSVAMEDIAPEWKQCLLGSDGVKRIEKYVLRKAFDNPQHPYLPDSILWRQKEQFSDGVGYSWIDELKKWTEAQISDKEMSQATLRFPHDPPTTKEAYYYRKVFEEHFPEPACLGTVMRWIPRRDWGCPEDPSGRAQKAHVETTVT